MSEPTLHDKLDSVTTRLVVKPPTKETPGYLRRQRQAFALTREFRGIQAQLKTAAGALDDALLARLEASNQAIVDFLLGYVVEPTDPALATEALLDLSEATLLALLDEVRNGAKERPLEPPSDSPKASDSTAG